MLVLVLVVVMFSTVVAVAPGPTAALACIRCLLARLIELLVNCRPAARPKKNIATRDINSYYHTRFSEF